MSHLLGVRVFEVECLVFRQCLVLSSKKSSKESSKERESEREREREREGEREGLIKFVATRVKKFSFTAG